MEFDSNDESKDVDEVQDRLKASSRPQENARKYVDEARQQGRTNMISKRRFGSDFIQHAEQQEKLSLNEILTCLQSSKFLDKKFLVRLKSALATGKECPEEFFLSGCGDQHLYNLVNIMSTNGHEYQLIAVEILANLSPLSEKNGLKVARSAGPYLITLLSSSSTSLKEASSVALGNLALSGFKVVKVLLHQDVIDRLNFNLPDPSCLAERVGPKPTTLAELDGTYSKVTSASLYALYHIIHTVDHPRGGNVENGHSILQGDSLNELLERCSTLLSHTKTKAPLELFWVLFVLSCRADSHKALAVETTIHTLLDICTYEIYQKSDPRPLVKVVTPICRLLANLCAGPYHGETACLFVLRHPDVTALLMALLGTNYTHLCKETLWLFANIVNSESVLVQEEIVELNLMDKLEFHTTSVVQKIDPYAIK